MQEVVEGGEVFVSCLEGFGTREGGVSGGGGEGNAVGAGKAEEKGRREGALEMEVVFAFREGVEEGVEGGFAHRGDWACSCGEDGMIWRQ